MGREKVTVGKEDFARHHVVDPDADLLDELQSHGFSKVSIVSA